MRGDGSPALLALWLLLAAPATAGADWLVSAFLGNAWTLPSRVRLMQPDRQTRLELLDVPYRGDSFASPVYYGYRVTWIPGAGGIVGVEAELIHAKVFGRTDRVVHARGTLRGADIDASIPLSSVVQRLAMSHGLNFILANLVVRRALGPRDTQDAPRLILAVRGGLGPTLPHAESRVEDVTREQYESGGLGAQLAGGLEIAVWRRLGVMADYKFTWTTSRLAVAGGEAEVPARSHHIVAGLSYRF